MLRVWPLKKVLSLRAWFVTVPVVPPCGVEWRFAQVRLEYKLTERNYPDLVLYPTNGRHESEVLLSPVMNLLSQQFTWPHVRHEEPDCQKRLRNSLLELVRRSSFRTREVVGGAGRGSGRPPPATVHKNYCLKFFPKNPVCFWFAGGSLAAGNHGCWRLLSKAANGSSDAAFKNELSSSYLLSKSVSFSLFQLGFYRSKRPTTLSNQMKSTVQPSI